MLACAGVLSVGTLSSSADWLIKTYSNPPGGTITNLATADALIGGFNLQGGAPVVSNYTTLNTQDNGGANNVGLPLGTQIVGLPVADNDDFAFVGKGTVTVNVAGNYTFINNTDDGSRLRGSVSGGPVSTIINDDVLSAPHDAASAPINLPAGAKLTFDWTWFERGGGAEGLVSYQRDGGTRVVVGDPSQGLSLDGGTYQGSLYKSVVTPGVTLNTLADAHGIIAPANQKGSALLPTFNLLQSGGDGHFGGGVQPPGYDASVDRDDFVSQGTGILRITTGGTFKFATLSDDGAEFTLKDPSGNVLLSFITDDTLHGAGDPGDIKYSDIVTLPAGDYPITALFFERGGGASGELFFVDPVTNAPLALVGDVANGGFEVVQSVPEPATLSLLGVGALALMRRRRRIA